MRSSPRRRSGRGWSSRLTAFRRACSATGCGAWPRVGWPRGSPPRHRLGWPHPDGGEPLAGTNPIAIGVPSSDGHAAGLGRLHGRRSRTARFSSEPRRRRRSSRSAATSRHKAFALAVGLQALVDALGVGTYGALLVVAQPERGSGAGAARRAQAKSGCRAASGLRSSARTTGSMRSTPRTRSSRFSAPVHARHASGEIGVVAERGQALDQLGSQVVVHVEPLLVGRLAEVELVQAVQALQLRDRRRMVVHAEIDRDVRSSRVAAAPCATTRSAADCWPRRSPPGDLPAPSAREQPLRQRARRSPRTSRRAHQPLRSETRMFPCAA